LIIEVIIVEKTPLKKGQAFFKHILFFCLDAKETKNQGFASSATCYSSIPKSKELAALKQLLI